MASGKIPIHRFLTAFITAPVLAVAAACLLSAPACAQASTASSGTPASSHPSIEERLAKLEAEVASLRQENRQLRAQIGMDATPANDTAVAASTGPAAPASTPAPGKSIVAPLPPASPVIKPTGSEQWLSVGGFVQFQAEFGDPVDVRFNSTNGTTDNAKNDRFFLRRARIVLDGHFAEDFDFRISSEMGGSVTESSSMRGQLTDGYIAWKLRPAFSLTLGQFKTSYGFEFLSSDLTIYPIEHALVTDVLSLGRQIGGQARGSLLNSRLNYAAGVFNGNSVDINTNDNDSFLYLGRINFSPVKGRISALDWDAIWMVGVNGYRSKDDAVRLSNYLPSTTNFAGKRKGWGVDTQLRIGPWDIWGEYLETEFDPDLAVMSPAQMAGSTTARGWYLQGTYTIAPEKWQFLVRYDTFTPDISVTGNDSKSWTFGVNYLLKGDDLKLMFNYINGSPFYHIKAGATGDDSASNAQRFLFRLQAVF